MRLHSLLVGAALILVITLAGCDSPSQGSTPVSPSISPLASAGSGGAESSGAQAQPQAPPPVPHFEITSFVSVDSADGSTLSIETPMHVRMVVANTGDAPGSADVGFRWLRGQGTVGDAFGTQSVYLSPGDSRPIDGTYSANVGDTFEIKPTLNGVSLAQYSVTHTITGPTFANFDWSYKDNACTDAVPLDVSFDVSGSLPSVAMKLDVYDRAGDLATSKAVAVQPSPGGHYAQHFDLTIHDTCFSDDVYNATVSIHPVYAATGVGNGYDRAFQTTSFSI